MLKQVTAELDVPDGFNAVYRLPKNGEDYLNPAGERDHANVDFRMEKMWVLVPIPPQMVPLGPEDVVPGQSILDFGIGRCLVVAVHPDGVTYVSAGNNRDDAPEPTFKTWSDLKSLSVRYSSDHGKTWQPMSKPAR